jgi:hypothetical protein
MIEYLPDHATPVDRLCALVETMGGDMSRLQWQEKTSVSVEVARRHVDEIASITTALCESGAHKARVGNPRAVGDLDDLDVEALIARLPLTRPGDPESIWHGGACSASSPCRACQSELLAFLADETSRRNLARLFARLGTIPLDELFHERALFRGEAKAPAV